MCAGLIDFLEEITENTGDILTELMELAVCLPIANTFHDILELIVG